MNFIVYVYNTPRKRPQFIILLFRSLQRAAVNSFAANAVRGNTAESINGFFYFFRPTSFCFGFLAFSAQLPLRNVYGSRDNHIGIITNRAPIDMGARIVEGVARRGSFLLHWKSNINL